MRFCIRLNVNADGIVTTVQGIYKENNPNFCAAIECDNRPFHEIAASYKYEPDVSRYTSFKRIYIRWNSEPFNIEEYEIPLNLLTFWKTDGCCVVNGRKGLQSC